MSSCGQFVLSGCVSLCFPLGESAKQEEPKAAKQASGGTWDYPTNNKDGQHGVPENYALLSTGAWTRCRDESCHAKRRLGSQNPNQSNSVPSMRYVGM